MEAFEDYCVFAGLNKPERAKEKSLQRVGFRTALRWTLTTEVELSKQGAPIGMREFIEKELEDK